MLADVMKDKEEFWMTKAEYEEKGTAVNYCICTLVFCNELNCSQIIKFALSVQVLDKLGPRKD